jgi:membrane-bound ClpP family serine protease
MSFYEFIQDLFRIYPPISNGQGTDIQELQSLFNPLDGAICILIALGLGYITYKVQVPGKSTWYLVSLWLLMIGLLFISRGLAYHHYNLASLDTAVRILIFPLGLMIITLLPFTVVRRLRAESIIREYIKKAEEMKQASLDAHDRASKLEILVKREFKDVE